MKHISTVPAAAVGAPTGRPRGPRPRRAARAGQGSARALPDRRGDGRGARARRGGPPVTDATADAATAVLAGAGVSDAAPTAVVRAAHAPALRAARRLLLRRDAAPPGAVDLALAARPGARRRRGDRGPLRLRADPGRAEREQAGRGARLLEGQEEALAFNNILDRDLEPKVVREFNDTTQEGIVFDQDPEAGERIERGNIVTIHVSQGKRKVDVPNVIGLSVAEAVSRLKDAGLEANPVEVFSDEARGHRDRAGSRRGQARGRGHARPHQRLAGREAGRRPERRRAAASRTPRRQLEADGFVVRRSDQTSNIAPNTVIETRPPAGTELQRGATVTVIVSKGPTTWPCPTSRGSTRRARAGARGRRLHRLRLRRADRRPRRGRLRARPGSARRRPRRGGRDDRDLRRPLLRRAAVSRKHRVAVMLGGRSSEHEISRASAESVLEALEGAGHDVVRSRSGATGGGRSEQVTQCHLSAKTAGARIRGK